MVGIRVRVRVEVRIREVVHAGTSPIEFVNIDPEVFRTPTWLTLLAVLSRIATCTLHVVEQAICFVPTRGRESL